MEKKVFDRMTHFFQEVLEPGHWPVADNNILDGVILSTWYIFEAFLNMRRDFCTI